jgi:hypothetical protein
MYWRRIIIEHAQVDIVDQFAAQDRDEHSGKWSEADRLGGGASWSAEVPSRRQTIPGAPLSVSSTPRR